MGKRKCDIGEGVKVGEGCGGWRSRRKSNKPRPQSLRTADEVKIMNSHSKSETSLIRTPLGQIKVS